VKNPAITITLIAFTALILSACGATKEQSTPEPVVPSPPPKEAPVSFRTSTDTIATSPHGGEETGDLQTGERIRFMIQIGAFRDPANASAVQLRARERYRVPVLNDYHTGLKLYQVRIGFFEDYASADKFRLQLVQEHPADYRDAWIVQLKR
jgi:cell division septation protein DedD